MRATARARCSCTSRPSAWSATTSGTRRSTATRSSCASSRRPATRSRCCARSSGSPTRSSTRQTGRCRSWSTRRSSSRRLAPTRSQKTPSRTSMPELSYREAVRDALSQAMRQVEAWFVHVPGLKVVFASTPADVRGLLWSAIYDDNPVVCFEHRTLYGLKEEMPEQLEAIPIGQGRVHREGSDVTVVATGRLVHEALQVAEQADSEGVSVEVWDPRTLQPLDVDGLVASVKKTNRVVVAHEAVTRGGFGAEITAVVQEEAFDWLDAPVERVGARFAPIPFAPVMENYVVPHADHVLEAIRKTVS